MSSDDIFERIDADSTSVADARDEVAPLPPYTVRTSTRTRRLHLRVSPLGRVEVVVPRRVAAHDVQSFVDRHRQWLQRTLARLGTERARYHAGESGVPAQLELRALDQAWTVERDVRSTARAGVTTAAGQVLVLRGDDEELLLRALRRWLQEYARAQLAPRLQELSAATGLTYQTLAVRAQRSRWGSCSARGTISLNRNLLFLPSALMRYVLIHELCHTRHLNHGQRYWRLVQSHVPEFRTHERELRRGDLYIPAWALAK